MILMLIVAVAAGGGGYYLGKRDGTPSDQKTDPSIFWKAWRLIDKNFYGTVPSDSDRMDGAIAGMVSSLKDPYTLYLAPEEDQLFRSDLQGSFGGVGAELTQKNGLLTIVSVLDGTPAQKAGLKAQDIIATIDGKKTTDMEYTAAINAIRGDVGTTVTLGIVRDGQDGVKDFAVVRDTIVVKSVKSDSIGTNNEIGYIKVNQFGDDTLQAFRTALQQVVSNGKKGIVIDLRDNPGGYLDTATQMIGMFLPSKVDSDQQALKDRVAVIERKKDSSETQHSAGSQSIAPDLPMVILVNGGSASASEIFSGAMKDYKRATILGTKTFGKGSVQDLISLGNGGSIKVTIAKWFTPLGNGIDGKGIDPDQVIQLGDGEKASTTDTQVQKALSILQK